MSDSTVETINPLRYSAEPTRRAPPRPRPYVDFHAIETDHVAIDRRLANWGRWCNGSPASITSPMFRLTPSPPRVRREMASSGMQVDRLDAARIAEEVAALPIAHRAALNWHYVKPVNPKRACQIIGTTMEGLAGLVRDGRRMLMNRGL